MLDKYAIIDPCLLGRVVYQGFLTAVLERNIKRMAEKKYSDEDFEALLSKYDYKFKRGDIVQGVVCAYESDGAIVDIGSKCTAFVPSYEVSSDRKAKAEDVLEKNTEYEFLITQDADENGKFTLSYKKVAAAHTWAELEKIKEANETIAATITQIVKGGIIVDISGVQGFIPQGQLCAKETTAAAGDKIEVKILTLDKSQNNLILSNKKVFETNMAETRKSVFSQVEVGQEINVEIIDVDHEKQRISLSLKNTEPDPWIKAEEELKEGDIKEGVVTRVKPFGAFVEVLPGVEALLPQSAVSAYQNKSGKMLAAGDKIDTKVEKFNPKDKRISLGLPTEEEPKE